MADLAQLEQALIRADAAGDVSAARQLAQAIVQARRSSTGPQEPEPMTVDPTEGMTGLDRVRAGMGKAFADTGRGLGQFVGLVDRADVAESRRLDEALMGTPGGRWGNFAGNVAAVAPTALIPGAATLRGAAAIGAGMGLAAPSVSSGETLKNTTLGAGLGVAGQAVGRALGAGYNAAKGLLQPLTQNGQQAIAGDTLRAFATNPQQAAANLRAAKPLVPGSSPTMAQVADDAGLAQLERTLANNPETGGRLADAYAAQRAARLGAIKEIAGTDEYLRSIKEGRRVFATEDYGKAFARGIDPEMAKSLGPQIKSLLGRPSIQQAQARAKELAREADFNLNDFSSLQGLDWLKKGLDDIISSAQNPTSGIGKEKLRALVQTKDDLMSVLEALSPAYKAANDNFAGMSRNINSMEVARGLQQRLEPALARFGANTREHGAAYAQALEAAGESVKKSTGMNKRLSDVMSPRDLETLQAIAKDFARKAKADDLGRGVGSNTAQNLAAQNLLRRTLGPTGLPQSWAENGALQTLLAPYSAINRMAGTEQRVLGLLGDAAQDPQLAARLLLQAQEPSALGLLGMRALPYANVPALGGLLSAPPQ